jgi:hypothetical protein
VPQVGNQGAALEHASGWAPLSRCPNCSLISAKFTARRLQSHPSPNADPCIETLGLSQDERVSLTAALRSKMAGIDPVVSYGDAGASRPQGGAITR